ncbi:MAG: GNAT family protein [Deltaproteobacteria bacterium]
MIRIDDGDLVLRSPTLDDAPVIFAAVDADRARLRRWLPWVDLTKTPDDTRAFVERSLAGLEAGTAMDLVLLHDGAFAGLASLVDISSANRRAMIGYWISSGREGRGLVTRAVQRLLAHGFDTLGLERIGLYAATDNTRSRAVAERCGLTLEGVLRHHEFVDDRFVDHAVYAILAEEWRDARG